MGLVIIHPLGRGSEFKRYQWVCGHCGWQGPRRHVRQLAENDGIRHPSSIRPH